MAQNFNTKRDSTSKFYFQKIFNFLILISFGRKVDSHLTTAPRKITVEDIFIFGEKKRWRRWGERGINGDDCTSGIPLRGRSTIHVPKASPVIPRSCLLGSSFRCASDNAARVPRRDTLYRVLPAPLPSPSKSIDFHGDEIHKVRPRTL